MESLRHSFEGRGPSFTDDIELHMDDLVRNRNLLKGWDEFDGMGFREPEMTRKLFLSTQVLENLADDANGDSGISLPSTSTITLESSMDFRTRFSSSAIETNDEKLAQSGFKIKKLVASRESKGNRISVENSVLSSPEPSMSAKRARITNLQSQVPVCIVHGCNKDLSSSKEYHKRHKVCDIHSKTAVVIVNGIQQRFHILAEFDEGKRSCRKRLAGHNERRRKPPWNTRFGSMLFGTDLSRTSLIYSEILPSGFSGQLCHEPTNYSRHVKLEEDPSQRSQFPVVPLKFGHSHPKSVHEMGKQYPSKNCLNSSLSVLELSAGSNPSCAFSLLSAQSQSLLSHSAGISFDHPLIFEASDQNSSKSIPKFFNPSTLSSPSGEVDQRVPDAGASFSFSTPENGVSQESNALNLESYPSPEGANTVDLVQLSLHLQRVEEQKYSAQVKMENGIFCHSTTF